MSYEPRLVQYRQHIVTQLKENIPVLRDVAPHVGRFGVETLKRFTQLMPAARVSLVGMNAVKHNNVGQMIGPCTSIVFVAAKDPLVSQAYGPAIDIAEMVADFIDLNQFGLDYASAALVTEITPIYSEDVDNLGAALVQIEFMQEIQIGSSKHAQDERRDYPDWTDDEVVEAGWPGAVSGGLASTMNVPNVHGDRPEPGLDVDPEQDEQEIIEKI